MKKLIALMLVLLLTLGTVALTSCEDEDDKKKNESGVQIDNNGGWSPAFKP